MIRPNILAALALLPLAAQAQEEAYRAADGTDYVRVEGELVNLVSRGEATHALAAGPEVSGAERLTFHRDCTATSSLLGEGTWAQGTDGVRATFRDAEVAFPGQEFWATPEACKP